MRTALLLLSLLALPALAAQTVWKWVDAQGVTHYSDRPVPGATKIELRTSTTPAPSVSTTTASSAESTASSGSDEDAEQDAEYVLLAITAPGEGETIANTGGQVPVSVRVEPALQSGDTLVVFLDGQPIPDFPSDGSHTLTEVPRGSHTLTAIITNQAGDTLLQSSPVRFFVRQASVANPPVGPALRPQPRPRPRGADNKQQGQPSYAALHGERPRIDPKTNLPVTATKQPKKP